jgi:hypothetical protein
VGDALAKLDAGDVSSARALAGSALNLVPLHPGASMVAALADASEDVDKCVHCTSVPRSCAF